MIEDNPAFQHPLILPQLFLFGCLAVEDICGSQSQCEKKKTAFPTIQCRPATPRVWKSHLGQRSAPGSRGRSRSRPSLAALGPDVQREKFVLIFVLFLTFHGPLGRQYSRCSGGAEGAAFPLALRHPRHPPRSGNAPPPSVLSRPGRAGPGCGCGCRTPGSVGLLGLAATFFNAQQLAPVNIPALAPRPHGKSQQGFVY